ncbi:Fpg/Nei family DNA glycosylase [Aquipuribacter nitratireducens]|uniref:DNA-(apurinic or apyrimidinic site) lyase n=1 Tax=Aquipuribacter nitratireducens TaxID=650104 RepID=A0ABW0GKF0_9MICO
MPEGHTVHRHARQLTAAFGGRPVAADSPQGRFAAGAAAVDGLVLLRAEAWGKHLFLRLDAPPGADRWVHVHLGLFGKWALGTGTPPEPRGALRLRLVGGDPAEPAWAELRGPTACELLDDAGRARLLDRLGPDPLRRDGDPSLALARVARSRQSLAALLMDQSVVAGVGNVYRAEVLFRAGLHPEVRGRDLDPGRWNELWQDLATLMRAGVRSGRIVTTEREHRERRTGAVRRSDAHYVYRRHGLPCRVCGTTVQVRELLGRRLYWCPACQAAGSTGTVSRDIA